LEGVGSGPSTLALGGHSEPGHHVHSGPEHALNGNLVALDRDGAGRISHHRPAPTLPRSVDGWRGDAKPGSQTGAAQLLAAWRLDHVHHLRVLRCIDERPVEHLLVREYVGDLRENHAALSS